MEKESMHSRDVESAERLRERFAIILTNLSLKSGEAKEMFLCVVSASVNFVGIAQHNFGHPTKC